MPAFIIVIPGAVLPGRPARPVLNQDGCSAFLHQEGFLIYVRSRHRRDHCLSLRRIRRSSARFACASFLGGRLAGPQPGRRAASGASSGSRRSAEALLCRPAPARSVSSALTDRRLLPGGGRAVRPGGQPHCTQADSCDLSCPLVTGRLALRAPGSVRLFRRSRLLLAASCRRFCPRREPQQLRRAGSPSAGDRAAALALGAFFFPILWTKKHGLTTIAAALAGGLFVPADAARGLPVRQPSSVPGALRGVRGHLFRRPALLWPEWTPDRLAQPALPRRPGRILQGPKCLDVVGLAINVLLWPALLFMLGMAGLGLSAAHSRSYGSGYNSGYSRPAAPWPGTGNTIPGDAGSAPPAPGGN